MTKFKFSIVKKLNGALGRTGVLETPHGIIETPAFVAVGTKGTVKSLSPKQVFSLGAQVVLANTYHLYLQPGAEIIRKAGGLGKFMNWSGPTMTDSGGFQVFSLGSAFGQEVSKISKNTNRGHSHILKNVRMLCEAEKPVGKLVKIDEDGVTFKSHIDGSKHRFTPESSIEIQRKIGADIIFAFDECTSPLASYEYQKEAMNRTHRWAVRSLREHQRARGLTQTRRRFTQTQIPHLEASLPSGEKQALFGVVQGGRYRDLREKCAKVISKMDFDGFGIGGSFEKEDMQTAVGWVNKILPENKPRHLLGIGEPADLFGGIENGVDLFDCVAPTRMARNGALYTSFGRINIFNAKFISDFTPIDLECLCYTCQNYNRAYVAHLFRAKEMYAATLASIHNLYFIVNLVKKIRQSILDDNFYKFKESFLKRYYGR